ncbi:glycosyltransferase family 9 protein [Pseudoalteromonas phenolica]|uniref:Glycosyltransferase family 9 protein n=1 Tax=Pseudoalteromonas phenolica TaxID=161398 RepID=A0A4V2EK45_9GAMM|nr:glycosyltransferase family 9 protein [Pseudoalteromonas phenolica]RZQ54568.1 glycosyltransferase family 9 protein [Pseudoalteromonas phenolica]TMN93952.1 glycosyltransferase family 9 protein [Pseudoalteromonas phenolica]
MVNAIKKEAIKKEAISGPILAVLPKFIGDAINTLSAIELIRKLYPDNEIYLLARPYMVELFARDKFYNIKVITDERFGEAKLSVFSLAKKLKQHKFSMAVLFRGSLSEALLAKLAGIKTVIGYAQNGRKPLLSHPLNLNVNHHYLLRYCRLINETHGNCFEQFDTPKLTYQQVESAVSDNDKINIGLYLGGKNKGARHYPFKQAKQVIALLNEKYLPNLILIGDRSEQAENQKLFEYANSLNMTCTDLTGKTSLTDLVDHIAAFDLLISIDSGPMHMAAALQTPCVAIVGQGTSPWSLVVPKTPNVIAATAEHSLQLNDSFLVQDINPENIVQRSNALLQTSITFIDKAELTLPQPNKQ